MEKDEDCTSNWVEEGHYSALDCPEFDKFECDFLDFVKKETHLAKRLTRVKDDKGCEITLRKHIKTWKKPKDDEEEETTKTVNEQNDDQKLKPQPKTTKKTNGTNVEHHIPSKQHKEYIYTKVQKQDYYKKSPPKSAYVDPEEVFPPAQYVIREKLKKPTEYDPGKKLQADEDDFKLHHIPSDEDYRPKYSSKQQDLRPTKTDKNGKEYIASNGTKKTAVPTNKIADDIYPLDSPDDPSLYVQNGNSNPHSPLGPVTVRKRNGTAVEDAEKKSSSRPVKTPRKKERPAVDDDFKIHPTAREKDHRAEYSSQKRDLRPTTKPTIKTDDQNVQYSIEQPPEKAGYSRDVQKDILDSYDYPPQTPAQFNGHSILSYEDPVQTQRPVVDDDFKVNLTSKHPGIKNDFKTNLQSEQIYNQQSDNGQVRNGKTYKSSGEREPYVSPAVDVTSPNNNFIAPFLSPEERKYYQQANQLDNTSNTDRDKVKIEVKTPVTNVDSEEKEQDQYKDQDDINLKKDAKYYTVPLPEINQELLVPVYDGKNKSQNDRSKDDSSGSSSSEPTGQLVPGVKRALAKALAKEVTGTSDSIQSFPGVKRALGKALVKEMTGGTKRSIVNGAQYAVQLQPWCKTGKTVKLHDEATPAFPVEVTEKYLATASLRPIEVVVSRDEETNANVVCENERYPRKEFLVKRKDLHPFIEEEEEEAETKSDYKGIKLRAVQPEPRKEFPVNQQQGFGVNLRPAKPPVTTVKPVYLVEDENGSRVYDMVDDKPTDARSRFKRAGARLKNALRALRRDEADDTSAHPPGWKDNRVFVPTDIAQPAKQAAWRAVKPASHLGPEIRWVQKN